MDYADVVEWFTLREQKSTFGLERIQRGCAHFNNVEASLRCVHVGGTNGKGSTCFKIAKVFENAGYTVGLFTSPHISSMCERIQINGSFIPENELARLVTLIVNWDGTLSAFEVMTLAAFLWYAENHVDLAVLEVGLGGKLDATNVCHPDLSIITSISLDHTEYLGTTLHSIAENKAGIIKKNTPVVIGPRVPYDVIERIAKDKGAPLYRVEKNFSDYDDENSAVAERALEVLQKDWPGLKAEQVSCYRPPCRFEEVPKSLLEKKYGAKAPKIILDVAHNPDGIDKLLGKLRNERAVFLSSISRDKDVPSMVSYMLRQAEGFVCTQAQGKRAMSAKKLGKIALDMKPSCPVRIEEDVERALSSGIELAIEKKAPLVVTGTFYLMDQVKRLL